MNRKERRAASKRAQGATSSTTAAMFLEAQRHHRANAPDEADALCRRILAIDPKHAPSLHLLGLLMQQAGRHDAAAELIGRAIAADARNPEFHYDIGLSLQALGRLDQAAGHFRQAFNLKPSHGRAYHDLGKVLWAQGRLDDAARAFKQAIVLTKDAGAAAIHHSLGSVLAAQGKLDEAVQAFERALVLQPDGGASKAPDYPAIFLGLGSLYKDRGNSEAALRLYERALVLKPDYAEAHNNIGAMLLAQGKASAAADRFAQALALTPELFDNYAELSATLFKVTPVLKEAVARVAGAWPRRLQRDELLPAASLSAVANDPVLRVALQSATIRDAALERFLTCMRRVLLDQAETANATIDDALMGFACALACQCFINEYVFALEVDEQQRAERLRSVLAEMPAGSNATSAFRIAVLASYGPLGTLPDVALLLERAWPDGVRGLLVQQVREPQEERQDRAAVPRLTAIGEGASARVREQYEENPYPRWSIAPPRRETMTVDEDLKQKFPYVRFRGLGEHASTDILVAGCGTGQHPIWIAQRYRGARVLAVDLSLTSLCYARRKTRELGLQNIDYAQADILQLGSIGRTFDLIDASGVLHHLADPAAGWRELLSLLRPHGLMRIGLYSELGRRDLAAARTWIAKQGYRSTAEDIRRCRQDIVTSPFASVVRFNDFFSTSECRDLLFHVQEQHLTIAQIAAFLATHELQFIGFEIGPASQAAYRLRFPEDRAMADLDRWQVFESEHPDTFAGMYQFWVGRR